MQQCCHCGYENPEGASVCEVCGEDPTEQPQSPPEKALGQARTTEVHIPDSLLERMQKGGAVQFSKQSTIYLHIKDSDYSMLAIRPANKMILGRLPTERDATGAYIAFDLSAYDAARKGISRSHAELRRDDDDELISLVDLGSTNKTYLNGTQLMPDQPRILRDGDEVRLGRMVFHVHFKAQPRDAEADDPAAAPPHEA